VDEEYPEDDYESFPHEDDKAYKSGLNEED